MLLFSELLSGLHISAISSLPSLSTGSVSLTAVQCEPDAFDEELFLLKHRSNRSTSGSRSGSGSSGYLPDWVSLVGNTKT